MSQSGSLRGGSGGGGGGTDYHVARFIVSAGGTTDGANYTTIASALTAAAAAGGHQTVFIQPGNYSENLTLQPNVNLVAFQADAANANVIITGKATATFTGACSISGIRMDTNGDYACEITGTNATVVNFISCFFVTQSAVNLFHCTNSTGSMTFSSCTATCGSANTIFVFTAGNMTARYSTFASGNSTVASTFADSNCNFEYCYISVPIQSSGGGSFSAEFSDFLTLNTTAITHNGTANSYLYFSRLETGTASAISIGAGATLPVLNCTIFSSNANTITGAGTIKYGEIDFYGSGGTSNINTTTQIAYTSQMGSLQLKNPLSSSYGGTGLNNSGLTINLAAGSSGYVLTSDVSGNGTWQAGGGGISPTYFQAYLTSPQTFAASSSTDAIIFDTPIANVGSAYNPANGIFTAPATGYYSFSSTAFLQHLNVPSGLTTAVLAYTGSAQSLRMIQQGSGSFAGGDVLILNISWSMPMTSGDGVKIKPFTDGSGNYSVYGAALSSSDFNVSSTFSGFRVA